MFAPLKEIKMSRYFDGKKSCQNISLKLNCYDTLFSYFFVIHVNPLLDLPNLNIAHMKQNKGVWTVPSTETNLANMISFLAALILPYVDLHAMISTSVINGRARRTNPTGQTQPATTTPCGDESGSLVHSRIEQALQASCILSVTSSSSLPAPRPTSFFFSSSSELGVHFWEIDGFVYHQTKHA